MKNELGVEAPVVFPDRNELGDKRLDPKENVAKLKENIRGMRQKHIVPEQEFLTAKSSVGQPMDWRELVLKLHKVCPQLLILPGGYPNAIQLRIHDPHHAPGDPDTKYVGGFLKDVLTEYDTAPLDQWGVAKMPRRGWRTVVKHLIEIRLISKKDADVVFGKALSQRNVLWEKHLQAKELK